MNAKTPAVAKPAASQLIADFLQFVFDTNSLEPAIPFQQLNEHMHKNGWFWRARQVGSQLNAQSMLIDYEISIGRNDDLGKSVAVDTVSLGAPLSAFNVSMLTRMNLGPSVIFLLFDRLPPMQPAAPAPQPDVRAEVGNVEVRTGGRPMTDAEIAARRAAVAPVPESPKPNGLDTVDPLDEAELPNVIDSYLPSGMPIFKNLDRMGGAGDAIVDAVIIATQEAMSDDNRKLQSDEQIVEFYARNRQNIEFVNDVGSPEQQARFRALLSSKAAELKMAGGGEPQVRRRPAAT